jgi:hypothetical protein
MNPVSKEGLHSVLMTAKDNVALIPERKIDVGPKVRGLKIKD